MEASAIVALYANRVASAEQALGGKVKKYQDERLQGCVCSTTKTRRATGLIISHSSQWAELSSLVNAGQQSASCERYKCDRLLFAAREPLLPWSGKHVGRAHFLSGWSGECLGAELRREKQCGAGGWTGCANDRQL